MAYGNFGSPDSSRWAIWCNELVHNRCLMSPVLVLALLLMLCVMLAILFSCFPQLVLGFLIMLPFTKFDMMKLVVEHLYPLEIGRWLHFLMAKVNEDDSSVKQRKSHSRTLEMRIEVIKDKLYIHMIPQLMDNICYVIIHMETRQNFSGCVGLKATIVDCGDAIALKYQLKMIHQQHYSGLPMIEITSVLCTHKHHDHTAGNRLLFSNYPNIKIFGAAVERVPYATNLVKNYDVLHQLALPDNVCVTTIICPGHTRGSVVYMLQNKLTQETFLFTGDVIFSGGGGEAFEARNHSSLTQERCFANIIFHVPCLPSAMILPGHDYTRELISMQLDINNSSNRQRVKPWQYFSPYDYFETVSQYLVAIHHRSLPNGKRLLNVPIGLEREIIINPYFRALRIHAENLVQSLSIWLQARQLSISDDSSQLSIVSEKALSRPITSESTVKSWNLGLKHTNHSIFTTVYSSDINNLIDSLRKSDISKVQAAEQLEAMAEKLKKSLTPKGFSLTVSELSETDSKGNTCFSSDTKLMKDAIYALSSIGSPPQALTMSDSVRMNLPPPLLGKSIHDKTPISKSRLIKVLTRVGVLKEERIFLAISLLFDEANRRRCLDLQNGSKTGKENDNDQVPSMESIRIVSDKDQIMYESCIEKGDSDQDDKTELGYLRAALFGNQIEMGKNHLSWTELCLSCSDGTSSEMVDTQREQKVSALLYHDMSRCPICKDTTACPLNWKSHTIPRNFINDLPPPSEGIECDVYK